MNTYQQYLSDCDAVTDLKNKLKHAEKNKSECEQRVIEQMALQGFDRLTTLVSRRGIEVPAIGARV